MPDALSLVIFLITVIMVCFVVHIMCQNHKLNKEKLITAEKISRLFDHLVVRPARQSKTSEKWMDSYGLNCMARGALQAFDRIYEGSAYSLSEILGLELDIINDTLLKHEDVLRETQLDV